MSAQKIQITDEYKQVKALIDDDEPLIFVTGKAGTGKSTLIDYLRKTTPGNCVVLAPTGVAAMNIRGATIHSFFRFPPRLLTNDDARAVKFNKPYKKLDRLIIDEVSMVRADVMDAMDRFLRLNGPQRDQAFGGVQVVLVGDLHQLPPVVAGQDEREYIASEYVSPFFFSSHVFGNCDVAAVELTQVFRQHDEKFIGILNQIRLGKAPADMLDSVNDRVTPEVDPDRETVLTTTNIIADRINKKRLAELSGTRRSYAGAAKGKFQLTSDRLPSPLELTLKPESRVMFTKNDSAGRWVNGTLGVVTELDERCVEVLLDHDGEIVEVEKAKWETYRYEFDEDEERHIPVATGSYQQLPLTPAWAITIHKSQGKTLSSVRVDLGRSAFAPGQVYVALSRCRQLDDLSLSRPIAKKDVFCDRRVISFYESLFVGRP